MYVKLVTEEGKRTKCYECSDYEIVDYGNETFLRINRHAGKPAINIEVDDTNGTYMYVENENGRTINSFHFLRENVDTGNSQDVVYPDNPGS